MIKIAQKLFHYAIEALTEIKNSILNVVAQVLGNFFSLFNSKKPTKVEEIESDNIEKKVNLAQPAFILEALRNDKQEEKKPEQVVTVKQESDDEKSDDENEIYDDCLDDISEKSESNDSEYYDAECSDELDEIPITKANLEVLQQDHGLFAMGTTSKQESIDPLCDEVKSNNTSLLRN